jgi:hypothetical protein
VRDLAQNFEPPDFAGRHADPRNNLGVIP